MPARRATGVEGADPDSVNLPPRIFLYTLDQIAGIISMTQAHLERNYIYYYGKSTGPKPRERMMARDINAGTDKRPDWRVADTEVVRWLRRAGFVISDRGWLKA